jgi:integrase
MQHGQVFSTGPSNWAYRYRLGGRDSKRMQRSGFPTEEAAEQALDRALERARQEQGLAQTPTLSGLVEIYLAQHDTEPETIDKLRWLLNKATAAFGNTPISELQPAEIAAWRMTIPYGHRFEATQALRQTLARAVQWRMINRNPAKQGVENPQRPRVEQRPFESWDELRWLADRLGRHLGPIVLFAAATGLRPSEWLALEHRDIDQAAGVVYVRRAYRNGRIKHPKTAASYRAVPVQRVALDALDALARRTGSALLFPAPAAATSTCTQLPLPRLETRPTRPRDRPDPARIRSQAHLCQVRAACRHLPLRPLPLHGRLPDDDRPPLRAPRQRRPPARDRPPRQLQQQPRPHGGREVDAQEGQKNRL